MKLEHLSKFVLFSLAINLFVVLLQYLALTDYGSMDNVIIGDLIALPLAAICIIVFPISLILMIFKNIRSSAGKVAIFSTTFFLVLIIGTFLSNEIREREFAKLAKRSSSLVDAIYRYEINTGKLPEALDQLVPDYLVSVPVTKMGAYPKYRYLVGDEALQFENNPWVLIVDASTGILNWDLFIYFPMKNYPEVGYGGYIQKMHNWAYVYE